MAKNKKTTELSERQKTREANFEQARQTALENHEKDVADRSVGEVDEPEAKTEDSEKKD